MDDLVIGQSDWCHLWLVGVELVPVRSHVASGTCISVPVSACIRNEGRVGVGEIKTTCISCKLGSFLSVSCSVLSRVGCGLLPLPLGVIVGLSGLLHSMAVRQSMTLFATEVTP